jgi:CRP/FNR family transcriptional regulator, dissimilatory nitrate respiration regulator
MSATSAPASVTRDDLMQFPILAALDARTSERALKRARVIEIGRGDHLFHQGDPARRIFLCRKGQLKLFRLSPTGQEKIIAIINPGRSFAEATLFTPDRSYPVHCAAIRASELVAFDADDLIATLRHDTEACFRLLSTMACRMHGKIAQIDSLALQNAHLRVAHYLLDEFRRHQPAEVFQLRTSKKHIAGLLAIQPETLSRSLAALQREGVLEMDARDITVTSPQLLERIALGLDSPAH